MTNHKTKLNSDAAALAIHELRFQYPHHPTSRLAERTHQGRDGAVAVAEFSLATGEQALLVGPSGCGKSTLLQLIAGLLTPRQGTVRVAGRDIFRLSEAERDHFRGRSIGMIFQTFHLLPGFTAAENVMAALMFSAAPKARHRSLAIAARKALGIDRPDAAAERLSVGQQQRVAVARAVVTDPALVLADEPTASLDPDSGRAAMDLIQQACTDKGAALLCVSHDPAMQQRFARVARLDELSTTGRAPGEAQTWR